MATKTKTVAKKKTATRVRVVVKRKKVAPVVTTGTAAEIFEVNPTNVTVAPSEVLLLVNGSNRGLVSITRATKLRDFVTTQAQEYGIRTFSVYVDGKKADQSNGNDLLTGIGKIEIVAKDARGER